MNIGTDELKKLVEQAEAVAASLKDADLRRVAFEKVLERLLSAGLPPAPAARGHASGHSARHANATAERKAAAPKTANGKAGPMAKVEEFIDQGYFSSPRSLEEILTELRTAAGIHLNRKQLATVMLRLLQRKRVRRQPGSGDEPYVYSNW